MKRVRRREGSRKGSGLGVRIEGLEARRLLADVPLQTGDVGPKMALWGVDTDGRNLERLFDGAGTLSGNYIEHRNRIYTRSGPFLYRSDGTTGGTTTIAGVSGYSKFVTWMGRVGENMYYVEQGYDSGQHQTYGHLYHLNNQYGTWQAISPYGSVSPRVVDGKLYLSINRYTPYSLRHYAVDGATVTEVASLPSSTPPEPSPTLPDQLTVGNVLFHAYDDGSHGIEPWVTIDGQDRMIHDLFPGTGSSSAKFVGVVNGRVLMTAATPAIDWTSATISGGVLFVGGGPGSLQDRITITSTAGTTTVRIAMVDVEDARVATFNDADFWGIVVDGNDNNDLLDLSGTSKPATIYGSDGSDTIIAGSGSDSIDGGFGYDTIDYSGRTTSLRTGNVDDPAQREPLILGEGGEADHIEGFERLIGGQGDDVLRLPLRLNTIHYLDGQGGNDHLTLKDSGLFDPTIRGGDGDDTMEILNSIVNRTLTNPASLNERFQRAIAYGDAGDDVFIGQNSANEYFGGDGIDLVDYSAASVYVWVWDTYRWRADFHTYLGVNVSLDDQTNDGFWGHDNVHSDIERVSGTSRGDRLVAGGPNAVTLLGNDGDDSLFGHLALDVLDGGAGINTIITNPSAVTIADGLLSIRATSADDIIIVRPKSGDPQIIEAVLNGANQEISALAVASIFIDAGAGNDRIQVDGISLPTRVYARAGNDTVLGGGGGDRVYGGDGNDWIGGFGGNDILYGEAGNDRLFGGEGRDYIVGGLGADLIRGENGIDQILAKNGEDDYRGNAGDVITLVA